MFSPDRAYGFAFVAGISLVLFPGCSGDKPKPETHSHGEHSHAEEMPESFAAAVAEIKEHAPEVKEAFEAGKPEDAHEALHHLGEIFAAMNGLIDSSDLTDEQKTQAKEASESLFDEYTKLDTEVLHEGSTELKYSDVESKIDEALAKLVALRPTDGEQVERAEENP